MTLKSGESKTSTESVQSPLRTSICVIVFRYVFVWFGLRCVLMYYRVLGDKRFNDGAILEIF